MKIVMKYSVDGGYECGCYEQTLCFEHESTEAFLVDFEAALVNAKEKYKNDNEKIREWYHNAPRLASSDKNYEKKKEKHEKAFKEWKSQKPSCDEPTPEFTFCG